MRPSANRLVTDTKANVAMMFALFLFPILIGVGMALDFTRQTKATATLQQALDSAALAAAANVDFTLAEKRELVERMLSVNSAYTDILQNTNIVVSDVNDTIAVTLTGDFSYLFLGVSGRKSKNIALTAEAMTAAAKTIELIMVLDYSSSMNDDYEEMADAAVGLITEFINDPDGTDYRIGVVPFAKYVYGTFPSEYIIDEAAGGTWTNCTMSRKWPAVTSDAEPTAAANSRWGSTDSDSVIDADEYDDCGDYAAQGYEITRLTDNLAAVSAHIDALTPVSGTNIALGMEIGWALISPNFSWSGAAAYDDKDVKKVVILLSDGRQSVDGSGAGGQWSEEKAVENIRTTCEAMRNEGVHVYTIAFDLSDPEGKDVLQDCAGLAAQYFEASASTIDEVFLEIGKDIRISPYLTK